MVCVKIFTVFRRVRKFAKSYHYIFLNSGVLKTVNATSGTGYNTGTATSLQRGLIATGLCESCGRNTRVVGIPITRLTQTSPDQATLEGSSCTDIMTCTGGCGYSF